MKTEFTTNCSLLLFHLCSSFYGGSTLILLEKNCTCGRFQFPSHLGSHILSSRVDLVCCKFTCLNHGVTANAWDFVCTQDNVYTLHTTGSLHTARVCTDSDSTRKIPCHTGESNLCQQCTRPDAKASELHHCP